ncbi:MAG: hypothetical protein Q6352_002930 [Candidatus Freyrarchaeum guaymaensis]
MSWIGLAPRVRQSGEKLRSGGDREGSPRPGVGPGSGGVGRRPLRRTPLREVPQDNEETRRGQSHGAPSPGSSPSPCGHMLTRGEPYRFSSRDFVDRKLKKLERRIRVGAGGASAEPARATPL